MGSAPTNNLPGVNVTLNDLGLRLAVPDEGPKVTIIGQASHPDLVVNEPYRVVDSATAIDTFFYASNGSVFTGDTSQTKWPSDLSLAVEAAFNAGAKNVEVMVTAIRTGSAITGQTFETRYNELSSTYEALRNSTVDVVFPAGYYFDEPESLSVDDANFSGLNFGKQLADFCYQATKEANSAIGVIELMPPTRLASWLGFVTNTGVETTNKFWNYSGYFPNEDWRFDNPSTALIANWVGLLNTDSNAVYLTGHFNYTGASDPLGLSGQRYVNSLVQSYLQGSELASGTIDQVHTNYLLYWTALDTDGTKASDSKGNPIDAGGYLVVPAAPLREFSTQARRLASHFGKSIAGNFINTGGGASVAGRITSLLPSHALTNKVIPNLGPSKILGRTQADKLVGRRFTTFIAREPGFVVAKDVTGARNAGRYARSDYVLLSTVRIVHAAVDTVRAVSEKYIGFPSNPQTRAAMEQEVRSELDKFVERGALNTFDISISQTPDQNVLGEIDINLSLVPATELVQVNLTVNLDKTLS